jgi:predicted transcriptional regulator
VATLSRFTEFKPHERGLGKVLGGLEAEIMQAAWSSGTCTVRDVHERLRLSRSIAYTTVMTVMSRLAKKGLLNRKMVDGSYLYEPVMSRSEFEQSVVGAVLDSLLESFSKQTMAHLVSTVGKQDDAELDRLAAIIAERRKEQKK